MAPPTSNMASPDLSSLRRHLPARANGKLVTSSPTTPSKVLVFAKRIVGPVSSTLFVHSGQQLRLLPAKHPAAHLQALRVAQVGPDLTTSSTTLGNSASSSITIRLPRRFRHLVVKHLSPPPSISRRRRTTSFPRRKPRRQSIIRFRQRKPRAPTPQPILSVFFVAPPPFSRSRTAERPIRRQLHHQALDPEPLSAFQADLSSPSPRQKSQLRLSIHPTLRLSSSPIHTSPRHHSLRLEAAIARIQSGPRHGAAAK